MSYRSSKVIRKTIIGILVFLLGGIIHYMSYRVSGLFLDSFLSVIINGIYIGLALFWGITLHQRVLQSNIMHYLQLMDAGVVFWMILRFVKYNFFDGHIVRYLWYLFYLPQIFLPLIFLYCALSIGNREDKDMVSKWKWLIIPASILFIGIMTNDLHKLAFKLNLKNWVDGVDYTYGILYYIVVAWMIVLMLAGLVVIFKKCKVCCSRRKSWIPVSILTFGCVGITTGLLSIQKFYNVPELTSATFVFVIESCMQIGLFHINYGYSYFFEKMVIPAELVDRNGKKIYVSAEKIEASSEERRKAIDGPVMLNNEYELNQVAVNGGTFYYCEDVKIINETNGKLSKIKEQLQEENELIKKENELKKRKVKLEERNRLYEDLSRKIKPQLEKIEELIDIISRDDEDTNNNLSSICVYGGYIKRLCNLMILCKENTMLMVRELENCIKESLDYLSVRGIATSFENQASGMIESEGLIQIYSIFEIAIEQLLDKIEDILIRIEDVGNDVSFKVMIETSDEAKDIDLSNIELSNNISVNNIKEDNTVYISVMVKRGEQYNKL